jgi:hypothetical protein
MLLLWYGPRLNYTVANTSNWVRWALSSLPRFEEQDQDFNLTEFYRNILIAFHEPLDFSDDCEVDSTYAEWITSTLRWWQLYVCSFPSFQC